LTERGVPIMSLGAMPQRAHGWRNAEARDAEVRQLTVQLEARVETLRMLAPQSHSPVSCGCTGGMCVFKCGIPKRPSKLQEVEHMLTRSVAGQLIEPSKLDSGKPFTPAMLVRETPDGYVLVLCNESYRPTKVSMRWVKSGGPLIKWDPYSGTREVIMKSVHVGNVITVYFSAVETLVFTLQKKVDVGTAAGIAPQGQETTPEIPENTQVRFADAIKILMS